MSYPSQNKTVEALITGHYREMLESTERMKAKAEKERTERKRIKEAKIKKESLFWNRQSVRKEEYDLVVKDRDKLKAQLKRLKRNLSVEQKKSLKNSDLVERFEQISSDSQSTKADIINQINSVISEFSRHFCIDGDLTATEANGSDNLEVSHNEDVTHNRQIVDHIKDQQLEQYTQHAARSFNIRGINQPTTDDILKLREEIKNLQQQSSQQLQLLTTLTRQLESFPANVPYPLFSQAEETDTKAQQKKSSGKVKRSDVTVGARKTCENQYPQQPSLYSEPASDNHEQKPVVAKPAKLRTGALCETFDQLKR